ncbi:hypothetical protein [Brachybacterium saurashtrense]|nr:hypothetical protein [Brachybacterium saurashtrense]
MASRWGNDDHGPGGDPSWLGGTDRGGGDSSARSTSSSDFSSDFSTQPSSDFASDGAPSAPQGRSARPLDAEGMAPEFSRETMSDSDGRGSSSADEDGIKGPLLQIVKLAVPVLVMLVVIGMIFRDGFGGGFPWFFLFFIIPMILRPLRILLRNLGR